MSRSPLLAVICLSLVLPGYRSDINVTIPEGLFPINAFHISYVTYNHCTGEILFEEKGAFQFLFRYNQ